MTSPNSSITFGQYNSFSGIQVGQNEGHISAHIHLLPGELENALQSRAIIDASVDRIETSPRPFSTVPFRRDHDFVDRGPLMADVDHKLSVDAALVALCGLGGIG